MVAIGYYLVSLLGIGFAGVEAYGLPFNTDVAKGVAVPIVLAVVYWGVHRVKSHIVRRNPDAKTQD